MTAHVTFDFNANLHEPAYLVALANAAPYVQEPKAAAELRDTLRLAATLYDTTLRAYDLYYSEVGECVLLDGLYQSDFARAV